MVNLAADKMHRCWTRRGLLGTVATLGVSASLPFAMPALAEPETGHMNVLLIEAEDMGLQLGCYGDTTVPTPRIDALANQGMLFEHAYAAAPTCSPSRASLYSGLYVQQHGHYGLGMEYGYRVHDDVPMVQQRAKVAGLLTGVTYKIHVNPSDLAHFQRIFSHNYFAKIDSHPWNIDGCVEAFEDFLDEVDSKKKKGFFFQANTHDTHRPFVGGEHDALRPKVSELGEPYRELTADDEVDLPPIPNDIDRTDYYRKDVADYYNAVQRFDWTVGRYVDALRASGKADNTVIIVTSDHGPPFTRGKLSINELGVRVPLIVVWPGVTEPGSRSKQLVSHIDLAPTIDQAIGTTTPDSVAGMSLMPILKDPEASWRDYVATAFFAHTTYGDLYPSYSMRGPRYKIILNLLADTDYLGDQPVLPENASDYWAAIQSPPDSLAFKVYQHYLNRPRVELYDLSTDPYEYHDLAADPEQADRVAEMLAGLQRFRSESGDPFLDEDEFKAFVEHYREKEGEIHAWQARTDGDLWKDQIRRGDQSRFGRDWNEMGKTSRVPAQMWDADY